MYGSVLNVTEDYGNFLWFENFQIGNGYQQHLGKSLEIAEPGLT